MTKRTSWTPISSFHLNAGVDYFIATDHALERRNDRDPRTLRAQGVLRLIHESDSAVPPVALGHANGSPRGHELGADWVINSDADEFWWPSGGDLKTVLSLVPERFGVLHTFVRAFLPRSGAGRFPSGSSSDLPRTRQSTILPLVQSQCRLCHRASPTVVVATGNPGLPERVSFRCRMDIRSRCSTSPSAATSSSSASSLSHFASVGGRRVDHGRAHQAAAHGRLRELYEEIYELRRSAYPERWAAVRWSSTRGFETRCARLRAEQGQSLVFPRRAVVRKTWPSRWIADGRGRGGARPTLTPCRRARAIGSRCSMSRRLDLESGLSKTEQAGRW